ncbi:MAG TPA: DUF6489 family protein [Rhizomicrobium sp.]|jgi:hypothetical protein
MKIHIEMDISPEEARAMMGLPDVAPLQAEMLGEMKTRMKAAMDAYDPVAMLKSFMPMGAQGFEQFQKAMWDAAAQATGGKGAGKSR